MAAELVHLLDSSSRSNWESIAKLSPSCSSQRNFSHNCPDEIWTPHQSDLWVPEREHRFRDGAVGRSTGRPQFESLDARIWRLKIQEETMFRNFGMIAKLKWKWNTNSNISVYSIDVGLLGLRLNRRAVLKLPGMMAVLAPTHLSTHDLPYLDITFKYSSCYRAWWLFETQFKHDEHTASHELDLVLFQSPSASQQSLNDLDVSEVIQSGTSLQAHQLSY